MHKTSFKRFKSEENLEEKWRKINKKLIFLFFSDWNLNITVSVWK